MIRQALFGIAVGQGARAALVLIALLLAPAASAQTFISALGNNASDCSRATPCRTLQRGVNATPAGRELTILNAGEYGRAIIQKSITISATGVAASIRSLAAEFGDDAAILIDNPGARVVLRGLFLTGAGVGTHGIYIENAASVHIVDCEVERFTYSNIHLDDSAGTELFVSGSISRNTFLGLAAFGDGATRMTLQDSRFENNSTGAHIYLPAGVTTIIRSVFSGNEGLGIRQDTGWMAVTDTIAAHNGNGFQLTEATTQITSSVAQGNDVGIDVLVLSAGGSTLRMSNMVVTGNDVGIENSGIVYTLQDNLIAGNGEDVSGNPLTTLPPQ